jgi:hypothetical protein
MSRTGVNVSVPSKPAYPSDLTPDIQRALATLADVETRYEIDRERVAQSSGPEGWKDRIRAALEARYRREREPLVRRLADLQREMTNTMMWSRESLH